MEIIFHKKFNKLFDKIPQKIQKQFFERLGLFEIEPSHQLLNNHSVEPTYPGWRSINITGDYRAFFEPIGKNSIVFMKIGTHSQLYK